MSNSFILHNGDMLLCLLRWGKYVIYTLSRKKNDVIISRVYTLDNINNVWRSGKHNIFISTCL